ncbi:MAG: radical SAM protein [Thermodesulfovibrionales bacterium]
MKICEIFSSIQGESSYAGLPCIFVRLSGCNLRCSYCDTTYAYEDGFEMTQEEVMEEVRKSGLDLVEITGGEPLIQDEVLPLINKLINDGYTVLIETNGSIDISKVNKEAIIIMDIKTPGSGMASEMMLSNLALLKKQDEVKFVLCSRTDYEWAREFIKTHSLTKRCNVLFSPAFGMIDPERISRWIIEDRLNVRLNIQIHKYIYSLSRGV